MDERAVDPLVLHQLDRQSSLGRQVSRQRQGNFRRLGAEIVDVVVL
jgi:hypothetical protein